MDQLQVSSEQFRLEQFHYWLTYGGFSAGLICFVLFLPIIVVLIIMGVVILGFSAYIIWTLIQMEKKGWLISYSLAIGLSLLFAILFTDSEIIGTAVWFLPVCAFYFSCWLLRYIVSEWENEIREEPVDKLRVKHESDINEILEKSRKDSF